jgi:hypothetical protein
MDARLENSLLRFKNKSKFNEIKKQEDFMEKTREFTMDSKLKLRELVRKSKDFSNEIQFEKHRKSWREEEERLNLCRYFIGCSAYPKKRIGKKTENTWGEFRKRDERHTRRHPQNQIQT